MEVGGGRNPHLDGLIEMSLWQPAAWIHGRSEVSTTGRNEKNKKHSFLTARCCCFFPTRRDAAVVRSSTEECEGAEGGGIGGVSNHGNGRGPGAACFACDAGNSRRRRSKVSGIQTPAPPPPPPPRVSHLSPSHDGPPASLSGSEQICAA